MIWVDKPTFYGIDLHCHVHIFCELPAAFQSGDHHPQENAKIPVLDLEPNE